MSVANMHDIKYVVYVFGATYIISIFRTWLIIILFHCHCPIGNEESTKQSVRAIRTLVICVLICALYTRKAVRFRQDHKM